MIKLKIYGKDKNSEILTVDDWFKYAPPRQKLRHWKDMRSAKEHAKFMTSNVPYLPIQLENILIKYTNKTECICYGESVTSFDQYNCGIGEGRNHDSLLIFDDLIVGIEAKAEESLDVLCGKLNLLEENKNKRYNGVSRLIYGDDINNHSNIRYQMLSASLGTLIEARNRNIKKAVLLIITYNSDILKPYNVLRNETDINNFINSIRNDNELDTVFSKDNDIEFHVEKLKIEL